MYWLSSSRIHVMVIKINRSMVGSTSIVILLFPCTKADCIVLGTYRDIWFIFNFISCFLERSGRWEIWEMISTHLKTLCICAYRDEEDERECATLQTLINLEASRETEAREKRRYNSKYWDSALFTVGVWLISCAARAARADLRQPTGSGPQAQLGALSSFRSYESVLPTPLPSLFYRLEAVHLGDLMRLWVRPGMISNRSSRFSRATEGAPDTERRAVLYQPLDPISG